MISIKHFKFGPGKDDSRRWLIVSKIKLAVQCRLLDCILPVVRSFCLMTFSGRILSITDGFGTWILGIISLLQHQICIYSPVLHYVKGWTPDCSVVDFNPSRYSDHLAFDSVRNFGITGRLESQSLLSCHQSPVTIKVTSQSKWFQVPRIASFSCRWAWVQLWFVLLDDFQWQAGQHHPYESSWIGLRLGSWESGHRQVVSSVAFCEGLTDCILWLLCWAWAFGFSHLSSSVSFSSSVPPCLQRWGNAAVAWARRQRNQLQSSKCSLHLVFPTTHSAGFHIGFESQGLWLQMAVLQMKDPFFLDSRKIPSFASWGHNDVQSS